MLLHSVGLYLIKWIADWEEHYRQLSDYQHSAKEAEPDLVDACVFSASHSVMLTVRSCLFLCKKQNRVNSNTRFQLSARTKARIHNAYSLEQLQKNNNAFNSFSDCIASIQLLSCFKAQGDPEGAFKFVITPPSIFSPGFTQRSISSLFSIPVMTLAKGISGIAFSADISRGLSLKIEKDTGVLWNSGILHIRN